MFIKRKSPVIALYSSNRFFLSSNTMINTVDLKVLFTVVSFAICQPPLSVVVQRGCLILSYVLKTSLLYQLGIKALRFS